MFSKSSRSLGKWRKISREALAGTNRGRLGLPQASRDLDALVRQRSAAIAARDASRLIMVGNQLFVLASAMGVLEALYEGIVAFDAALKIEPNSAAARWGRGGGYYNLTILLLAARRATSTAPTGLVTFSLGRETAQLLFEAFAEVAVARAAGYGADPDYYAMARDKLLHYAASSGDRGLRARVEALR